MPLNPNDPHELRLVVVDVANNSPNKGEYFAVDPNAASGVPLPTFQTGPALPPVGVLTGEGFFVTSSKRGYVWDGSTWLDVTPSLIIDYDTDALLLADNGQAAGTYAHTRDTGNLYVFMTSGVWKQLNTRAYATVADMVADTPPVQTMAEVTADGSLWEFRTPAGGTTPGWSCSSLREFPTLQGIIDWNTATTIGDRAIALDTDIRYIRSATGWKPTSVWEDTEANILAATWALNGQEALASDTGNTFRRVAGQWLEDPLQHYPTQTALLAATPPDGTLAWADDTSNVFARAGGNWKGMNTGFADPIPIGTISAFPTTTVPGGWLKCDGSPIPAGSDYDELRAMFPSGNVPDLQGEFLRGTQTGHNPLEHVDWSTARPHTAFTTDITGVHDHGYNSGHGSTSGIKGGDHNPGEIGWNDIANRTDRQGGHRHNIDGGGDAETAPDHTYVVWCIKAKHATIIPTAMNMTFAMSNPADGDVLTYNLAQHEWRNQPPVFNPTFAPPIGDGDILIYNQAAGIWYNTPNRTIPHAISNPAAGEVLTYDTANNAWKNAPAPGVKVQTMTQAAYDALGTKDATTLYLITGP
jgi:hypothetical protein